MFWYYMYGDQIEVLNVYLLEQGATGLPKPYWMRTGSQGEHWIQAIVEVANIQKSYQVCTLTAGSILDWSISRIKTGSGFTIHQGISFGCVVPKICSHTSNPRGRATNQGQSWIAMKLRGRYLAFFTSLEAWRQIFRLGFYMGEDFRTIIGWITPNQGWSRNQKKWAKKRGRQMSPFASHWIPQ